LYNLKNLIQKHDKLDKLVRSCEKSSEGPQKESMGLEKPAAALSDLASVIHLFGLIIEYGKIYKLIQTPGRVPTGTEERSGPYRALNKMLAPIRQLTELI